MASETTEWTVRRVLEWTIGYLKENGSESPRLEAEVLLAHACGWPRIHIYTHFEEVLDPAIRSRMRELVKRRAAREPVAYLVGYREFFSLRFEVGPGVFIPRPETETLVIESLEILKSMNLASARVLDLCTGSGAVGVSIAVNAPSATITSIDLHPEPVATASRNAERHHVSQRVRVIQGNLFEPLPPSTQFHVIACNPPYVTTGEIQGLAEDVRRFEPHSALDGGPDGLDPLRLITRQAPSRLESGGWLLFELSPEQGNEAIEILHSVGLQNTSAVKDLAGQVRVVRGQKP